MKRRSRTISRIAVATLATLLAAEILRTGLATLLGGRDPRSAARIAPDNARIAVAAARVALAKGEDVRGPTVSSLATAALRRDATLPAAIELRALALEARGEGARAKRLFELSNAVSRRSLPTRLWLIQQSVDRGDVAGALANFDLALRTSSDAPDILFPVLAEAASDPGLVKPIARILDRPSDWRIMFLNYAITEADAARDIGNVVLAMRDRSEMRSYKVDQALVGRLVGDRRFSLARRVHELFEPQAPPAGSVADPTFANAALVYPFGWGLSGSGQAWAARDRIGGRPVLAFHAAAGHGGQVAAQLLNLAPGRYRLLSRSAAATRDRGAPPQWTLTCGQSAGPLLAQLDLPATDKSVASIDFAVPPGCEGQWLALALRPSEASHGQSGAIASVSIRRP